jgi:SAM-dependent methyltransferase
MSTASTLRRRTSRLIPRPIMRRLRPGSIPSHGRVDLGDLRRPSPISRHFGFDRGLPIDRFYVERFLGARRGDIHGRVLEIGDATYTRRFGEGRVTRSDVLHVPPGTKEATIVADLSAGDAIESDAFDAVILTQTLHLIWDFQAAVATLHRILAPNGVVLATVPGITQIERGQWRDTWYWSFTEQSMTRLFGERFGPANVDVAAAGNALSAVAFLEGLAADELRSDELLVEDEAYPVCITIRAVKRPT